MTSPKEPKGSQITPETTYLKRRELIKNAALFTITAGGMGASLVALSSLSTVGALFLAGAPPGSDTRALFNGLLMWGLAMAVVGAGICWVLFG